MTSKLQSDIRRKENYNFMFLQFTDNNLTRVQRISSTHLELKNTWLKEL